MIMVTPRRQIHKTADTQGAIQQLHYTLPHRAP